MKRLPVTEMFYLPRKPVSQAKESRLPLAVLILMALFLLAFCIDNFTPLTQTAHAQAPQHSMTAREACALIEQTGEEVRGASAREVASFCSHRNLTNLS